MSITGFINKVDQYILNPIIILVFVLSMAYFVYGVIRFLYVDSDDKGNSRAEARSAIMWGVIGMVIMFSVYGIIAFMLTAFGISASDLPPSVAPYIRFY